MASREHVRAAVDGGFCQLAHGKEAPVGRLQRGDAIIYYSPRERMGSGDIVRAFTAIGRILDDEPFQVAQTDGFKPFRRKAHYFDAGEAGIKPLLGKLRITRGKSAWGQILRRGTFEIDQHDHGIIADAMDVEDQTT